MLVTLSVLVCGLLAAEAFPPPVCSNFSNQWMIENTSQTSKIGEYAEIVQMGCDVMATNPVEMWSPARGQVVGNVLSMFGFTGKLVGNKILWDDGHGSVWKPAEALPLEEGLTLVRTMLQHAIETEHSVIQPYLSALYSMMPGTNLNASSLLHDVVVEEMLHLTAAANLLNAVGGHPHLNESDFTPTYPKMLPFCNLSMDLAPFTKEQMNTFRLVEEASWGPDFLGKINTIGVFYFRIGVHLDVLSRTYGEAAVFSGDPALQVIVSSSRGKVNGIFNLSDAKETLTGVYTQGEGAQGALYETSPFTDKIELSHFYRFNEIVQDRCYAEADNTSHPSPAWDYPTGSSLGVDYNMSYKFKPNPRMSDFTEHKEVYQQMMEFNACYTQSLADLHMVFNGSPDMLGESITSMVELGKLAKKLMAIPDPNNPGMFVSPSFEWVNISDSSSSSCPSALGLNGMLRGDVIFA